MIFRKRVIFALFITVIILLLTKISWFVFVSFPVNICFFIMLAGLIFWIVYKVLDYKILKEKSIADILFLAIFFTLLFVPMVNIDKSDISENENRTLAKVNLLIKDEFKINYNFGKDFEKWFSDRFFLRENFIEIYNFKLLLSRNWITNMVVKGKEDWLFMGDWSLRNYSNNSLLSDEELKIIENRLNNINTYCNNNGRKFYFVIVPDKESVYGEYYNEKILRLSKYNISQQISDYLDKNTNIKVINLEKILLNNKDKGLLYYKQDLHWNGLGAYIAYQYVMKNYIKKDIRNIPVYKAKSFVEKDDEFVLLKFVPYFYKNNKTNTKYNVPEIPSKMYKNNSAKFNLLIFGDSFSEKLLPYFDFSFNNTRFIYSHIVDFSEIKDSDIVILQCLEGFLPDLIKQEGK